MCGNAWRVSEPRPNEAFDAFYERGAARLGAQIYAFTGDATEALDIVQEAYLRAWTRWARVSRLDDPQAWVRRVAYNLAKNHNRSRQRLSIYAAPPQVEEEDPSERPWFELSHAMAALSNEQRQAVVLHYLGGLTVQEIAAEMSVPVGTVKSWLSRARAHLAASLEQQAGTDDDDR